MWIAPVIALCAAGYLLYARVNAFPAAAPILSLWFVSPYIAWWVSKPLTERRTRLAEGQIVFLRKLSRKTWAFFEAFVGPDDHWLPPDNYQEEPLAALAHRTSPTNMGLALPGESVGLRLWLHFRRAIHRTHGKGFAHDGGPAAASRPLLQLVRHESLKALLPMYVSSVDSGNLAASLLTLRAGLLALPDEKLLGARLFDGLEDTFLVLSDVVGTPKPAALARMEKDLEAARALPPDSTLIDREGKHLRAWRPLPRRWSAISRPSLRAMLAGGPALLRRSAGPPSTS